MECRCYHGGEGRTRLKELHFQSFDVLALILGLALCVLVWVLSRFGL